MQAHLKLNHWTDSTATCHHTEQVFRWRDISRLYGWDCERTASREQRSVHVVQSRPSHTGRNLTHRPGPVVDNGGNAVTSLVTLKTKSTKPTISRSSFTPPPVHLTKRNPAERMKVMIRTCKFLTSLNEISDPAHRWLEAMWTCQGWRFPPLNFTASVLHLTTNWKNLLWYSCPGL